MSPLRLHTEWTGVRDREYSIAGEGWDDRIQVTNRRDP